MQLTARYMQGNHRGRYCRQAWAWWTPLCVGLCLWAFASSVWAQDSEVEAVQVYAELTPAITPYHMPVTLRLVVEGPLQYEYNVEQLPEELPGLEIDHSGRNIEELRSGRYRVIESYQLDPMEASFFTLPALTVRWGEEESTQLPPMVFHARSLSDEERENLAALAPLIEPDSLVAEERFPLWVWMAAILGVLALVALLAWLWLRHKAPVTEVAPPAPPWESALQRLKDLEARHLPESGLYERYYVDLSAILRYYIEDRFEVHAPEQTTPEFLEAARKNKNLEATFNEDIVRFLRQSDRVKFALFEPDLDEMKQSFEIVRAFIQATIPREENPETAAQQAQEVGG